MPLPTKRAASVKHEINETISNIKTIRCFMVILTWWTVFMELLWPGNIFSAPAETERHLKWNKKHTTLSIKDNNNHNQSIILFFNLNQNIYQHILILKQGIKLQAKNRIKYKKLLQTINALTELTFLSTGIHYINLQHRLSQSSC